MTNTTVRFSMVSSEPVRSLLVLLFLLAGVAAPLREPKPDEGMWTFDNLPMKQLKEKYGFEPSKEWIDHVRQGSVRFDTGGSGSFVSPRGLVMTNHHVALTTVQKLSNKEHDYVRDGFSSATFGSEVKCEGLTLRQLVEIRDLTSKIEEATKDEEGKPARTQEEKDTIRATIAAKASKEAGDPSKHILGELVSLYNGAVTQVYVYKIFDDVRLVFAPEQQIAFFGGDPDNFTYPRYDLDCAFFRVYEDDKPIDSSKWYFKWNPKGAAENELIFVPGNPGSTERLNTYAQLEYGRDFEVPTIVKLLQARRDALAKFMAKGEDEAREVRDEFFGIENSLKAYRGHLAGLRDAEVMAQMKAQEEEFRKKANDPKLNAALDAIAEAQKTKAKLFPRLVATQIPGITGGRRGGGGASPVARFIAAVAAKRPDPFADKELPKPNDLQRAQILAGLQVAKAVLAADDPFMTSVMKDRSPEEVAEIMANTSKVYDPAYRKELAAGGSEALAKADDPLILAVTSSQRIMGELRQQLEERVNRVEAESHDAISAARFAVYGKSIYPDATFTLRLTFGKVQGYVAGTTNVPYKTTFTGLYERSTCFDNKPPYNLPERWVKAREKLDLATPLNFVCTADIIGGNSGSPILNKDAEIVGLIFDGNIESLPGNYWYDERINRAVGVHSAGMLEAIKKVYAEDALVKELSGS